MFDELKRYRLTDHFFFKPTDDLAQVCNAPNDKGGVYIIYALKAGGIELVYIGCSGSARKNGKPFITKAGLGGLRYRLVNGKQFGGPRSNSWRIQMTKQNIEALDIYWYVTHRNTFVDCPKTLETELLQKHFDIYGRLPRWNTEFLWV